jgi:hypothetical protein
LDESGVENKLDDKKTEITIAVLRSELDALKKTAADLCTACDRCLIRKAVMWLIAMVGVAVVGAIMTLIIRGPK